jgi:DNA polymerase III delta prime subunit
MQLNHIEPQTLDELVLKPGTRRMLDLIVADTMPLCANSKSGLVLYGPPGTGKTTAARLLPGLLDTTLAKRPQNTSVGGWSNFFGMTGVLKQEWSCGGGGGGTNRGVALITEIQNKVANGWRGASGYAYIILNEVDELNKDAMGSLRSLMNRNQNVVFIFTTNHLDKLEEAVMDRCYLLDFSAAELSEWAVRCNQILVNNGFICLSEDELAQLYTNSKGSARQIVSNLQAAVALAA